MYRENDRNQSIVHINFVFDDVGIGDSIAALPALKYIYDFHPHVIQHIWVPDYFVEIAVRSLPIDKKRIIIKKLSDNSKYNEKFPGRSFKTFNYLALATHPTTTAFLNFISRDVDNKYKNYLNFDTSDQDIVKFNLPEKYITIPVAYTTEVRQFLPEHVNKIAAFIKNAGYTPVFIGKKSTYNGMNFIIEGKVSEEIDMTIGVDLLDKTSILETREIIKNGKCLVGLDSGLVHLAGTTDVNIVVGYTTVDPKVRMPYRDSIMGFNCLPVVPPETLACRFCQSNMNMTLGHDFRNCFYKDNKCTKELSADLYIEKIKEVLK